MKPLRPVIAVLVLVAALSFVLIVLASEFSKTFSVTGGSPQRLSTILVAAGYQGIPDQVQSMEICVPNANANTLYIGQSNVSASNGFPVRPGQCKFFPYSSIPYSTSKMYVFIDTAESESFSVHGQGN